MDVDEAVQTIAKSGLLTERQAEAYVLRDVELLGREAAAQTMGISPNVLDKHLRAARDKVEQAEATVDAIQDVRFEDIPAECEECGAALGGSWATDEDDRALCFDCAGVEPI